MPEFETVVLLELEHQPPSAGLPTSVSAAALVPPAGWMSSGGNDRVFLQPLGVAPPSPAPTSAPPRRTAVQAPAPPPDPPERGKPLTATTTQTPLQPLNR